MYTGVSCPAALRALRSMQQLLGTCMPLPGAAACGVRRMQTRAFSADAAEQLVMEEARGSAEMASRNARAFTQVPPAVTCRTAAIMHAPIGRLNADMVIHAFASGDHAGPHHQRRPSGDGQPAAGS